MGIGNALAALSEGWFGGVEKRHAWEDRAEQKARQKKLDAFYEEEFGWRREGEKREAQRHGTLMAEAADADRVRDRVFADDEALRAAAAQDLASGGSNRGLGIAPDEPTTPPLVTSGVSTSGGAGPVVAADQPPGAGPAAIDWKAVHAEGRAAYLARPDVQAVARDSGQSPEAMWAAVERKAAEADTAPVAGVAREPAQAAGTAPAQPPAPASAPAAGAATDAQGGLGIDPTTLSGRPAAKPTPPGPRPADNLDPETRARIEAAKAGTLAPSMDSLLRHGARPGRPIAKPTLEPDLPVPPGIRVLEDGTVIPPAGRSLTAEESLFVAKAAREGKLRPDEDSLDAHERSNRKAQAGMRAGGVGNQGSLGGDLDQIDAAGRFAAREGTRDAWNMVAGIAERGANAMRRADAYILGREPLGIREVDPKATGRLLDTAGKVGNRILDALGFGDGSAAPAADPEKPATQAASAKAADTLEQTPSGEAVVAAATGGALGLDPRQAHPEERRAKAADSFVEHFGSTMMPNTVKTLISQGRFDEAQKLQEWADSAGAKKGLRAWAKAGMAAAIGDERGFIQNTAEAYNTAGYFDDGYQMIPSKSGFTRTEGGDIAGAYVTFKDEQTGEEFTKTFAGADDLMQMGIQMLSPESILEHQMEQQKATQEVLVEQAKAKAEEAKAIEKRLDDVAKTIFDAANKNTMPGEPGMTYGEARRQAEEELGLGVPGEAIFARVPE